MSERVNQSELARRLGLTEGAVRKHIRRGLYRKGKDGLFDADECARLYQANADPDAILKGIAGGAAVSPRAAGDGPSETSLTRARTASAAIGAQRQQLALQKEKGELIRTDEAFRAARAVVTVVCERLDGAAAQIAQRAAGLDAVGAERVAREIIDGIRSEIAAIATAIQEVADEVTR